jgi:hypothetical protein
MGIGFSTGLGALAIASAVSPKIGAITGYLTGIATGRLFGNKAMPTLLTTPDGTPIRVSVITSTAHSLSTEPTKLTIENGAKLSDHAIIEPYSVTIAFEVSNVEDESRNLGTADVEWSMDAEITKAKNVFDNNLIPTEEQWNQTLQKYNPLGRLGKTLKRGEVAGRVYALLVETMEARKPLTLNTLHFKYDNMLITGINAEEPAPYKGKLEFIVTLTEIRQVALQSTGRSNAKTGTAKPERTTNSVFPYEKPAASEAAYQKALAETLGS